MTGLTVRPTMSPSMDIQVSSNFERLLFDGLGRDGAAVAALMSELDSSGGFRVDDACHAGLRRLFAARAVGEDETLSSIAAAWRENGILIDPHTAVGMAAARALPSRGKGPVVALATAHPAKFPDVVERATGVRPALPPRLSDLYDRAERFDELPNDAGAVRDYIRSRVCEGRAREAAT